MSNSEQIETWLVKLTADHFEASEFVGLGEKAFYASDGDEIWVKLTAPSTTVRQRLMTVPGERWQERDGRLFLPQGRVPTRQVPDCKWFSAEQWFHVELPRANIALRGDSVQKMKLSLSRGGREQAPAALVTKRSDLRDWAESAPDEQLRRLRWVVGELDDERCLVLGKPLPPIPGNYLVESEHVLIPAGFFWKPSVKTNVVRQIFDVPSSAWLYWESNERFHIIDDHLLVPLTRSGLRSQEDA